MTTAAERLTRIWETPSDLLGWLTTVDHKQIGIRYSVTAFVLFVIAGFGALLLRLQLARPESGVLSPELYNQIFTMHGTTMVFFFATPMLFGFGNYFIPL